tara:strand:+ start:2489 stop:2635 length:147 start_codon:yes stop_codon:yes gene_type:complete
MPNSRNFTTVNIKIKILKKLHRQAKKEMRSATAQIEYLVEKEDGKVSK